MRIAVKYFKLLVIVLGLMAPEAFAQSLPDLIDRVRHSVVGIGTAYPPRQPIGNVERVVYRGTGFVVGDGHQVITNLHVLATQLDTENRQSLAVFIGSGATVSALVAREVRRDEAHDLVLLEIGGPALPALQVGDSNTVREGQDVAFTGFPIGMALGLHPVTHRGTVSAITPWTQPTGRAGRLSAAEIARTRNRITVFQLDGTAYPGNSGSPVFDLNTGEVVGVVNSVLVKETKEARLSSPSGISYAIPAKHVKKIMAPLRD